MAKFYQFPINFLRLSLLYRYEHFKKSILRSEYMALADFFSINRMLSGKFAIGLYTYLQR